MPCTTILVGKNASYDGSTIIARNDDSGAGSYTPKKYVVVKPEEQPRIYKSEISAKCIYKECKSCEDTTADYEWEHV